MEVSCFFRSVDRVLDYTPGGSTINSAINLIQQVGIYFTSTDKAQLNTYSTHLYNKPLWRSLFLLAPVIGNIIVWFYDYGVFKTNCRANPIINRLENEVVIAQHERELFAYVGALDSYRELVEKKLLIMGFAQEFSKMANDERRKRPGLATDNKKERSVVRERVLRRHALSRYKQSVNIELPAMPISPLQHVPHDKDVDESLTSTSPLLEASPSQKLPLDQAISKIEAHLTLVAQEYLLQAQLLTEPEYKKLRRGCYQSAFKFYDKLSEKNLIYLLKQMYQEYGPTGKPSKIRSQADKEMMVRMCGVSEAVLGADHLVTKQLMACYRIYN